MLNQGRAGRLSESLGLLFKEGCDSPLGDAGGGEGGEILHIFEVHRWIGSEFGDQPLRGTFPHDAANSRS